uniref:Sosondowah ankyrin repeat domain family member C n=1 Tax=Oryzias sinensis TaxID=183150 RepID=A0A8C7ZWV5_9TELE
MASQITEEAVQGFLSERGGRVQQMELMDHFLSLRGFNDDQSDEGLRRIVDSLCLVKVENGVKYVCLNAMRSDSGGPDHQAECNGNIREALDNKHCQQMSRTWLSQVRRSLINRGPRVRDSLRSEGDSASLLSSATDEDCALVTLDPLEHEWMLCASDGMWESLQPLLAVEPSLVAKRDFVTGFTCLHWAAKQGKAELLSQLLGFAKKNTVPLNVNVRSSAGYTPLHMAAMHGHSQVVRLLLSDWEADPEARDYSGRRAIQYLPPPLAADLQQEGVVTSPTAENAGGSRGGGRGWKLARVLQGNLNPLRRLHLSAEAAEEPAGSGKAKGALQRKTSLSRLNAKLHRGRHRAQIIHSASFRDSGEVEIGEDTTSSPLRTRPLSSLFG